MAERNFGEMLERQWSNGNFVCVGLDPDNEKLPDSWKHFDGEYAHSTFESQTTGFLERIVEATHDLVCAYKPNTAFFERRGWEGWRTLGRVIRRIHEIAPDVPVILDAKRADIGNTNVGYAEQFFGEYALNADAVTVHPYLGAEAMAPFLEYKDKGIFVLCRTSNPGAGEFQDLPVAVGMGGRITEPLYRVVAQQVAKRWNVNGNCGLVVGATHPKELFDVRLSADGMPLLIPGIGAQGGDLEKTVRAGKDSKGRGFLINSSRDIIFASSGNNFAEAARRETEKLSDLINRYREMAPVAA